MKVVCEREEKYSKQNETNYFYTTTSFKNRSLSSLLSNDMQLFKNREFRVTRGTVIGHQMNVHIKTFSLSLSCVLVIQKEKLKLAHNYNADDENTCIDVYRDMTKDNTSDIYSLTVSTLKQQHTLMLSITFFFEIIIHIYNRLCVQRSKVLYTKILSWRFWYSRKNVIWPLLFQKFPYKQKYNISKYWVEDSRKNKPLFHLLGYPNQFVRTPLISIFSSCSLF